MKVKSLFGNKETAQKNNLSLEERYRKLSEGAQLVLSRVADHQESGNVSTRGVYVEHDKAQCKPYETKFVSEVLKSGLVTVHPDSEKGVAFLFLNKDVVDVMESFGDFEYCA